MTETDVVVVGGGIVGTSAAAHLGRDVPDASVTLLEKGDLLGGGTTADSIAMFGWSYEVPGPLKQRSWETYGPLVESGDLAFERIGRLDVAESEEGTARQVATRDAVRDLGLEAELLEPDDLVDSPLSPPPDSTILSVPAEGYLDTGEIVAHFASLARDRGAEIRTGVAATDVRVADGAVAGVETEEGHLEADVVVNATGPWAPRVNEMAGVSLPLRHNRGPILVLEHGEPLSLPNVSFENGQYVRGEGATQAFAGQRGAAYADAAVENPDAARSIDAEFYVAVERLLSASVPTLSDAEVVNEWVGQRTITPDGHPYVGETGPEGFVVACGLSGHGVTLAPAVGELVAETVEGAAPPASVAPDRFADGG
jgi:sarcosine oxidase subunit beta